MTLLKNLFNLRSLLIVATLSLIFFNIDYYIMSELPGYKDNMCVPGGGLTPLNIFFSAILSIMVGIFVATFVKLAKTLRPKRLGVSSLVGTSGFILGNFTVFCPLCLFPAISLFGLSIGLSFFTTYNLAIKLLSLALLIIGLIILNKKLKQKNCNLCHNSS